MSQLPLPPAPRQLGAGGLTHFPHRLGHVAPGRRRAQLLPRPRSWSTPRSMPGSACSTPPISMASTAPPALAMPRRCWAKCWPPSRPCAAAWCCRPRAASARRCPMTRAAPILPRPSTPRCAGCRPTASSCGISTAPTSSPTRRKWPARSTMPWRRERSPRWACRTSPSSQIAALQQFLGHKLVATQPEISPLRIDCFRERRARSGDDAGPGAARPGRRSAAAVLPIRRARATSAVAAGARCRRRGAGVSRAVCGL